MVPLSQRVPAVEVAALSRVVNSLVSGLFYLEISTEVLPPGTSRDFWFAGGNHV